MIALVLFAHFIGFVATLALFMRAASELGLPRDPREVAKVFPLYTTLLFGCALVWPIYWTIVALAARTKE